MRIVRTLMYLDLTAVRINTFGQILLEITLPELGPYSVATFISPHL
jgi:hypothetical protein